MSYLLRKLLLGPRLLDLDGPDATSEDLEIISPEFGGGTPRRMIRRILQVFIRKTLEREGIAFNLFWDRECDCLRLLKYTFDPKEKVIRAEEFPPAPGCIAHEVLAELRHCTSTKEPFSEGILRYKYKNRMMSAAAVVPHSNEVRLFFTDIRSELWSKLP